jgi:tripartite-type tricarboxylate transporter receptor subunit TctC
LRPSGSRQIEGDRHDACPPQILAARRGCCRALGHLDAASAQNYPARPLRLILGYPAGGSTDLVARIMGAWLTDRLGQSVVIENKPGAGTNLAVQAAVASPPNGYTLLFVTTTNAINTSFHSTLPFDFLRDLAPVAGLVELPFVMEVNPSVPANTVAEFIAHAKANSLCSPAAGRD